MVKWIGLLILETWIAVASSHAQVPLIVPDGNIQLKYINVSLPLNKHALEHLVLTPSLNEYRNCTIMSSGLPVGVDSLPEIGLLRIRVAGVHYADDSWRVGLASHQLVALTVNFTLFSDTDLEFVGQTQSELGIFELGCTKITDAGIQTISKRMHPVAIDASSNRLSDAVLPLFSQMPDLLLLSLGGVLFSDEKLGTEIEKWRNITHLYLHGASRGCKVWLAVAKLPSLKVLDASNTHLDEMSLQVVLSSPSIQELYLHGNDISERSAEAILENDLLKRVSVSTNSVGYGRLSNDRLRSPKLDVIPVRDDEK